MPCYSTNELIAEISACGVPANRADVIRILADICTSVDALIAWESRLQRNNNSCTINLLANTNTQFDISETTITETPVGSLVGNAIVTEYTGMYRISYNLSVPTTSFVGTDIVFNIESSINLYSEMQEDTGATLTFVGEIYRRLASAESITFWLESEQVVTGATGIFYVEYLAP